MWVVSAEFLFVNLCLDTYMSFCVQVLPILYRPMRACKNPKFPQGPLQELFAHIDFHSRVPHLPLEAHFCQNSIFGVFENCRNGKIGVFGHFVDLWRFRDS